MIGKTISQYTILKKIGQGGMGQVYLANDSSLDRKVALKFLSDELQQDETTRNRFLREAKSAAALDHPFICKVFEIGEAEGESFIAMEFVEGQTLTELLQESLPLSEVLRIAQEIAEALEKAHQNNIVHRDLKPSNIMLTSDRHVKIMDFGLAKHVADGQVDPEEITQTALTQQGTTLGTLPYMSPEQVRAGDVDQRSDIFAFGIILYQMLAGVNPFQKQTAVETGHAILNETPPPLNRYTKDAPELLQTTISQMLAKAPDERLSLTELKKNLEGCQGLATSSASLGSIVRQRRFALPVVLFVLAVAVMGVWLSIRVSRTRWVHNTALPEINDLIDQDQNYAALRLIEKARRISPADPELVRLFSQVSVPRSIQTTPPGAEVYVRDYSASEEVWDFVGVSPIPRVNLPFATLRWRIIKEGFVPVEASSTDVNSSAIEFTLEAEVSHQPGMVRIPGGSFRLGGDRVRLSDYWLDRFEVTNEEYKEFVDSGGYERQEYWKQPFVSNGETIRWEQGKQEFVDRTGRPGPSTWEVGTYPANQDEHPVDGVSWYEAQAYCEFRNKTLPTVYHWRKASGLGNEIFSPIVRLSNFLGKGTLAVGALQGLGPFGNYDMAGNVKEWCWNSSGKGRYILGGGWNEPAYMFQDEEYRRPLERQAAFGFRCAKYEESETITAPVETFFRDFRLAQPVNDEVFRVYENLYGYSPTELMPEVEAIVDELHWRKERITFDAAYGGERVTLLLFLPKDGAPPYQTVVYAPGWDATWMESSDNLAFEMSMLDFVIKSGRAVAFPIYKGTYERGVADSQTPDAWRVLMVQWFKDLGRSLDYLETRPDIDSDAFAFYGLSHGATTGSIHTALEHRFKASILLAGGLDAWIPKEIDQVSFLPRVRVPTLMLDGRHDYFFPLETSIKPMFSLLGTPEEDKRLVLFESGHIPPRLPVIKEALSWLDRYLGPVKRDTPSG